MEVERRVCKIISSYMDVKEEEVTGSSRIREDLLADTLEKLGMIGELESVFYIEISDEEYGRTETVSDIFELVSKKIKE